MRRIRKICMDYDSHSDGEIIQVILHPYSLVHIEHGWHVLGYVEQRSRVELFKVDRIVRLDVLKTRFTGGRTFDPRESLGKPWARDRGSARYHVILKFKASVAADVDEITWHETQKTTFDKNGSLVFEAMNAG